MDTTTLVIIGLALMIPDRRVTDPGRVPMAGSAYPVPPIDLQIPNKPRRSRQSRSRSGRRCRGRSA